MKLQDTLKNLRMDHGLTLEEMADRLNRYDGIDISKGTISRWENGTREPKNTYIAAYAKEFGLDLNAIYGLKRLPSNIVPLQKARRIPILGTIACGEPIWAEQNYEGYFIADYSIKADFCLYVKGDSMKDADILDGDIVFLKRTPEVENGEIGAVLVDDEATLKRVYKTADSVVLQPCNTSYPPIIVDSTEDIMILGEMVGVYHPTK